jgi:hypothetical protein
MLVAPRRQALHFHPRFRLHSHMIALRQRWTGILGPTSSTRVSPGLGNPRHCSNAQFHRARTSQKDQRAGSPTGHWSQHRVAVGRSAHVDMELRKGNKRRTEGSHETRKHRRETQLQVEPHRSRRSGPCFTQPHFGLPPCEKDLSPAL